MAKPRRKLSAPFEREIALASKDVELINAKIHDIRDDDIREEFARDFFPIKQTLAHVSQSYTKVGISPDLEQLMKDFHSMYSNFISEYEV